MRTCSVCGRNILRADICSSCYKKWANGGNYPVWLRELTKMQSSFDRKKANDEIVFTDDDRDLSGEKLPIKG